MRCPRCDCSVSEIETQCHACGLDLAAARSIANLREAIRWAKSDAKSVAQRLDQIERQIDNVEGNLASQGTSAVRGSATPRAESGAQIDAKAVAVTPPLLPCPELEDVSPSWERRGAAASDASPSSADWYRRGVDENVVGQKWLLIAGILLTMFAAGYFLKYSFDRNWIGPTGRVLLVYLAGAGALGLGEVCRRKGLAPFGLAIVGGGLGVLYFAGYAAYQFYDLVPMPAAFGLLVVVTALAGILALKYDTVWLAVLGILGGFLTPLVLHSDVDRQMALMSYVAVLNGGIFGVALYRRWHLLNYLGLICTWLVFTVWYVRFYDDGKFWATITFLNVFFLIYAVVPFLYYFVRFDASRVTGYALTVPNAFAGFGYSYLIISRHFSTEAVTVAALAYAAIFLVMAACLYRRDRKPSDPFILLLSKGCVFLALAVPLYFSRHWITVGWVIQGVGLLWAALRLADARLRAGSLALLCLGVTKFVAHDLIAVFEFDVNRFRFDLGFTNAVIERWLTMGVVLGGVWLTGRLLIQAAAADDEDRDERRLLAIAAFALEGVLAFLVLNLEVAAFFYDYAPQARFASISVLWACFATALMVLGFIRHSPAMRSVAIVLYAATILKVFVRDMVHVEAPYRILSFLILGMLLVGSSYLYHRFRPRDKSPTGAHGEAAEPRAVGSRV